MKRFVIGDIHGAHKAMVQCLQKASFNYEEDMLVCLGDICDGFPEVSECIDELIKIKNLIYIMGNHDKWFLQWLNSGTIPEAWLQQGGSTTIQSYNEKPPEAHYELLNNALCFHIDNNSVFVHGGFDPSQLLTLQDEHTFLWDRNLVMQACSKHDQVESLSGYERVFVGHTPTLRFKSEVPLRFCEVILMDTGAGWGEKLSVMNIDSNEVFQSDPTSELYDMNNTR